ncbi:thioredoxin-dependent thiol peroxidase [Spongorhabdus nitratireducens]
MAAIETLQAGDKAPAFTLNDQNGEPVSLADQQGSKVLVYFYPKASTPGCTVQACSLTEHKSEFDHLGVKVFGISPDPVKRLKNFETKKELAITLLSDEDHAIADAFGVWGEKKFMGRVFDGIHRITFLIDENGMIENVFNKFKTKDHHQVVLDYFQS